MRVLHVLSRLDNKPFILAQIESLRRNGVEIDILSLNTRKNKLNYFTGIFKLRKRLKHAKYDLVHAHYGYCGLAAIFQKRARVIISFMGSDLQGVLSADGKQTLCGVFNIIVSKIAAKNAAAIIVKSNKMKEDLKLKNVYLIPNGVDFTKFKPISYDQEGLPGQKKIKQILFVTTEPESRNKNLNLATQAIEVLKKNIPNVQLSIISKAVQEKVAEAMNMADTLLFTSRLEGSPNVIKEAMACNLPIVSTDVGDVKEIIGKTKGCFIASFEPEDVAEKIRLALDFGRRTNGRENITHLEINNIARRIITVYRMALA